MRTLICVFLLAGCTTSQVQKIEWVKLDQQSLNRTCDNRIMDTGSKAWFSHKPATAVNGCFKMLGDTCYVYTGTDYNHETLGHEVRHCYEGLFH